MQRSFDTPGPVTLDLRVPTGDIVVDPTLDGRTEVELIGHDEESRQLAENARIEQHDGRIVVEVPQKRGFALSLIFGRSGFTCRVRCPHASSLEVRSKSADVEAYGTLGDASIGTASGDTNLARVTGNLNVKTASGDIHVERVNGSAVVNTASGDVSIGHAGASAVVNGVSGDVRIARADGETTVTTVSGDQEHESVGSGSVHANSVSGDVSVAVRRGTPVYLDCNTVSGDTHSDLDMTGEPATAGARTIEIRIKTVSGDIQILRAPQTEGPSADNAQEVHA